MSGRGVLRIIEGGEVGFWCPGCKCMHAIPVGNKPRDWQFNGDYDRPTFAPSIKVSYRHPEGHTNENPAPIDFAGKYVTDICHSFVRAGQIEYLADCTHALKGSTVRLAAFE